MTRTLLIADDAMIIREIVKDTARQAGWQIVGEAENGQQAIDQYQQHRPDVVTLDLVMPHYDGLHGLRGIMQANPAAKVVIVSALDQKGVLREAFRSGAADFLVKPFARKDLQVTLDKLMPAAAAADNGGLTGFDGQNG